VVPGTLRGPLQSRFGPYDPGFECSEWYIGQPLTHFTTFTSKGSDGCNLFAQFANWGFKIRRNWFVFPPWLGWCCFAAFTSFSGPLLKVDRATGEQGSTYIFPMNGQVKDTYKKRRYCSWHEASWNINIFVRQCLLIFIILIILILIIIIISFIYWG